MSATAAQRRELKKKLLAFTNGLFGYTTDFLLYCVFMNFTLVGKSPTSRGVARGSREAEEILETVNYQTIKNALANLKRKGLLKTTSAKLLEPSITQEGIQRIKEYLPTYKTKRTWDKLIYLISYDLPNDKIWYRRKLIDSLTKWGSARIQDSFYITPYNPKKMLEQFTKENGSYGEVLISTLSKDSSISEEKNIKELLWRYYKLEDVNHNYEGFIVEFSRKQPSQINKIDIATLFLAIVKKDPQLPFELLPDRYAGDRAYLLFRKLLRS